MAKRKGKAIVTKVAKPIDTWKDGQWVGSTAMKRQVDEAVAHLKGTIASKLVETVLECGGYLLENFFDGDVDTYYSQDPTKPKGASFNALMGHPELKSIGLSGTTLRNYVGCYIQAEKKGHIPHNARHLGLTHRIRLLPIDNGAVVANLAERSMSERWTVAELQMHINDHKPAKKDSGRGKNPKRFTDKIKSDLAEVQRYAYVVSKSPTKVMRQMNELYQIQGYVQKLINLYTQLQHDPSAHSDEQLRIEFPAED